MTPSDHYAVFGDPISHSKSPKIHRLFAEQTQQNLQYDAQRVPAETFHTAVINFFNTGGKGLNCTIPLKGLAWEFANHKTARAELSMAVNTLALQADGSILGDNTDGIGLLRDLIQNHHINIQGQRLLILGAGGATRGIIAPFLEQSPSQLTIANRTVEKAAELSLQFQTYGHIVACGYEDLAGQEFDLIINATSTSLTGELPPLPETLLTPGGYCYDLAYGNQPTAFVAWGLTQNASKSVDGLGMLVEQAAEAFYIWRQIRPKTLPIIELLNTERSLPVNQDP